MTMFLAYTISLFLTSFVCAMGLRLFGLSFIGNNAGEMFHGTFWTIVLTFVLLVGIALIFAYFVCLPLDKLIKKVKKEGYTPTESEKRKSLRTFNKLNYITIVMNLIGFFLGQLLMEILGIANGRKTFDGLRISTLLCQSISFGVISALASMYRIDNAFMKFREPLQIHSLDNYKKECGLRTSQKILITFYAGLFFMSINMFALVYGYSTSQGGYNWIAKATLCFFGTILYTGYPMSFAIVSLRKRMKKTTAELEQIAKKRDISRLINISVLDDFGTLTTSINEIMITFSKMLKETYEKTTDVADSAETISDSVFSASTALEQMDSTIRKINENSANQNDMILDAEKSIQNLVTSFDEVKKRSQAQTDAVDNISASITEITSNINSVAETAKKAQNVSNDLEKTSQIGKKAIENAEAKMQEINTATENVKELIISIQKIAAQTNLLSMNAAIEAAHAGEFGAGFAVVADEVRALAASSAKSATNIKVHMNDMFQIVKDGVDAINSAGKSFNAISEKVQENAQFVNEITGAMKEQSIGAEETQKSTMYVVEATNAVNKLTEKETEEAQKVSDFMTKVVEVSKTTSSAVDESAKATANLKEQIKKVDSSVFDNRKSIDAINEQLKQFIY